MIRLLKRLLEIDTVDSKGGEEVISAILESLRGYDFEYSVLEFDGVKNLVAYNSEDKLLALCGHYDVVPAAGDWSSDPFNPIEKDGFIYARGAGDMKGGLAAAVDAFSFALKKDIPSLLMINGDEELGGFKGAKPTLDAISSLLDIRAAIVAEPTSKERVVDRIRKGARGVIWLEVEIIGNGGHASRPADAKNPLEAASTVVSKLRELNFDDDETMDPTTLCPTYVCGGGPAFNAIPSKAVLRIDVRNNLAVHLEEIKGAVSGMLDGLGFEHNIKVVLNEPPFFSDDPGIEEILGDSVCEVCGSAPEFFTGGGSSDARFFSALGIPAYEVGVVPRNIHAPDEHVSIGEVKILAEVFKRALNRWNLINR